MQYKFSDRIGITTPPAFLQVEEMTRPLRNSLWNYLLKTILAGEDEYCTLATRLICDQFFKLPLDTLPYFDFQQKDWLKGFFFHDDFKWYKVYNLIEFIAEHCHDMRRNLTPEIFPSSPY